MQKQNVEKVRRVAKRNCPFVIGYAIRFYDVIRCEKGAVA